MQSNPWKPNRQSELPLHVQIERHIREKIAGGEWPAGTKLPSQRRLADAFGVNRSTVVTALDELAASGLLEGNRGGGTRVVSGAWGVLAAAKSPDWNAYVRSGSHRPNLPAVQEINRAEFLPGIIRLGTGELSPELLPQAGMQRLLRTMARRTSPSLGYGEPGGDPQLRELLSARLRGLGIQASPRSILIVSGALQALQLISIGLMPPGSSVLLERPSYLYSVPVFQSAGIKLRGIPMDAEGIRTELIAPYAKTSGGALLYTIPSFHNPTGLVMSKQRRSKLLEACAEISLPVLEDDVYRDLWLDTPPPSPLKALDDKGLVLYMGSLSKTVSPGLRIGWIAGPEPVIDRLADLKMLTDYGSSQLSQWAAREWLASGMHEEHLDKLRRKLTQRRDAAAALLHKHFQGLAQWHLPAGGFYIWMRLIEPVAPRVLFEEALRQGLLLNPGYLYDPEAADCLRLSYAYASPEELKQGIPILADLVRHLSGQAM
ncbi:PLP-dependent aminotransferase family protein [Paenibacillus sp. J22TS3]|uniref:aminotransferase-like domain-containing protein n=1 Tax=Paenibacillus sp. J22TS3 TaxID=2807192 RepID=UPI001B27561D|nr:PLP-dependent aminotransferase family protein [Paenibacillus sp. J22TS3]GIP23482.1 putative HTH-type transcriptional regulator YisV [Paenibacillus sp. J22TS3]